MTGWWRGLDLLGRVLAAAGVAAVTVTAVALGAWWHTYWAQYVAQNVLPPSVWTLFGIAIAHLRLHRKLDAHHEDLKAHITAASGQGGNE